MRKIFVVDNKIIEKTSGNPKNIYVSTFIDIVVLEFISLIFILVLPTDMDLNTLYTIIAIVPGCFVLFKFFFNVLTSNFSVGVATNQTPYVVLYDNKMLIINNAGVVEPTVAITYGSQLINGGKLVKSLIDLGFTVAGYNSENNEINREVDISDIEKVIKNEVSGFYNIITYENVSFEKEIKNSYLFRGTLLDKNGNRRGERKFALMKIYTNYEELKKVK